MFITARTLSVLAVTLMLAGSTFAVDFTWDVDGNGLWDTSGNWDVVGFPNASTDNATITNPNTLSSTAVIVTVGPNVTRDVNDLVISDNGANADHELFISNNTFLDIHGSLTNNGVLSLNSFGNPTQIRIESGMTFSGSGSIALNNSSASQITGTGAFLLTNGASHTIRGGGSIGMNTIGMINNGIVDADTNATTMTIDPGLLGITNTNIMRATNGGTLALVGGNFGGAGTLLADGASSLVTLNSGATVISGTLNTTNGGKIRVVNNITAALNAATNQGDLEIFNNADLNLSGTITNNGTMTVIAAGNPTGPVAQSLGATLTGTGKVVLGGNPSARIAAVSDSTLVNDTLHTLEGLGNVGSNTMSLDNRGTVNANVGSATLWLDPVDSGSFDNTGTMKATNGGLLRLLTGTYNNTSGLILADGAGSQVQFDSVASVNGGTLRSTNSGLLRQLPNTNAFFTDLTIEGNLQVDNNSDFGISGTITNNATITVVSVGNVTGPEVQDGGATLTGSGKVVLSNHPTASIDAINDATLTNDTNHTIEGRGNVGRNLMSLVNKGTVHANVTSAGLFLDPVDTGSYDNTGTMKATNGGVLQFGTGTFNNTGGVIEADGTDGGGTVASEVQLLTTAEINGGILRGINGGLVRQNQSTNVFLEDLTIQGQVQIDNNSDFGITGTITNNATITAVSVGNVTGPEVQAGGATFTGSGKVVLSNNFQASIDAISAATLVNDSNHTIEGRGQIGRNTMNLSNLGTIDANVTAAALQLDPVTGGSYDNTGMMKATNGGILILVAGTFNNAGGNVLADGAGSEVQFASGAAINGGTLNTTSGGLMRQNGSTSASFANLTNQGDIQIDNNADFDILGTIINHGTITAVSVGNDTGPEVQAGGATLTGTGKVVLSGNFAAAIDGVSGETLTHDTNHTIEGFGQLGRNTISVVNKGTVDANVTGQTLQIDPATAGSIDNTGTLKATGGGFLNLAAGTYNNTGGLVLADGAGSTVFLVAGASVNGGILQSTSGGLIRETGSISAAIADLTIEGNVQIDNNSDLKVSGTIVNNGTITAVSIGNGTGPKVQATGVTFTGSGKVVLSSNFAASIDGVGNPTLINDTGHTIEGGGEFGRNTIAIDNKGLIHANSAIAMRIDPDAGGLVNTGEIRTSGAGGLNLHVGTHNNHSGGLIDVQSLLSISSSATLTNELGGLVKGTGTIDNNGTFTNDGTVAPGVSPGVLTVDGDYTQGTTGTLEIEINPLTVGVPGVPGVDNDQLAVTEDANLGGTADIILAPGFTDPTVRGTHMDATFLTAGLVNNVFDSVPLRHLGSGLFHNIVYETTAVKFQALLALPGDADGDLDVDITDFNELATNFDPGGLNAPNAWTAGNFDGDNDVDITDFNNLATNFAPGGYDGATASVTADANPGEVDLIVDLANGEVILDGNNAAISGLQVFSAGNSLLATDFTADVLQFVISTNTSTYAEGAFANMGVDGQISLGMMYDLLVNAQDLTFEYTVIGQPTIQGVVTYIPEPASLVLMGVGSLLVLRRRRA